MAVSHFRYMVEDVAPVTLEDVEVRPHFPVDFSPRNSVSLSHKGHKLLQVPCSIDNMFGSNLAVIIYIGFGLAAMEDLSLVHCKKLIAVGALVEVVIFFFEEQLKLLHEKSTN
jgi:hypothetical protein